MKKLYRKVYIEITNNCNLNCSFCSKVEKPSKYISTEEFEHILKEVQNKTDYIYLHVKGEPLLHPKLPELLELTEKYNLKVNLTTNGTLFPKVVDKIKDYKCLKKINFSLHSENNYPNYLEEIFKNVEKLNDVTVVYRLWTLNNNELDEKSTDIVDKIANYYNLSTETVDKIKTKNNVGITSTIYVDKDNEFDWPSLKEKNQSNGYCFALKTQIAILCDGTVTPCCLDCNGIINLGNIFKQSLDDIINSEKYTSLKKSFQDRKPNNKLCQNCTYKNRFNK